MPTLLSNQSILSEVGRVGRLDLQYTRQNQRTILAQSRCSSPWHLFLPMYLDSSDCAFTSLVNASGGFVAGDHLIIQAALERGAHVVLSTPSANRVYAPWVRRPGRRYACLWHQVAYLMVPGDDDSFRWVEVRPDDGCTTRVGRDRVDLGQCG